MENERRRKKRAEGRALCPGVAAPFAATVDARRYCGDVRVTLPNFFRNRSTRPAVSTSFCLPV